MRVVFTPRAERQLDELYSFVMARAGEARATAYLERIVRQCRKLEFFPHRGTRRNEIRPGLRTFGFERRATIVFVVEEEQVTILGVFYGGQDYEGALKSDDWEERDERDDQAEGK